MSVAAPQRFSKTRPCPICAGGADMPRGKGVRCSGFLSDDGAWAHCTREEHAGQLEPTSADPPTFGHRLEGECGCGHQHGPAPLNGHAADESTFDYHDEHGELVYQVLRKPGKRFLQRRPDGNGGWTWNLNGTRRVLYRLANLLGEIGIADTIYIAEGEKDVDAIVEAGASATCNPGGAGKWRDEFSGSLTGAKSVRVIADRDDEGRKHAETVAASLREAGVDDVTILEAAQGKDAADHLAAGLTLDELVPLAAEPLPTVTLREFVGRRDENAHGPLIVAEEGTIAAAGGLILLAAKASDGKTTFAVDFSCHAEAGRDYCGLTFPQPVRVLWIENEGPREAFRAKIEARLATWDHAVPRIWDEPAAWGAMKVSAEEARQALRAEIERHSIDIVLSDSLTRFGMSGNGTPEETRQFVDWLVEMGLSCDVAFFLLHHPRTRAEPGEDELDRISGAWGPHIDTLLTLKKLPGNRARLGFSKTRWANSERPASIPGFNAGEQSFTYLCDDEAEERDLIAELEDVLADGNWRTVSALREPKAKGGVGAREEAVREALADDRFEQAQGEEIERRRGSTYYRLKKSHEGLVGSWGFLIRVSRERSTTNHH